MISQFTEKKEEGGKEEGRRRKRLQTRTCSGIRDPGSFLVKPKKRDRWQATEGDLIRSDPIFDSA
jgi:hypothetical protein